jgi:DNA-binding Lrp family transcriptional regulator
VSPAIHELDEQRYRIYERLCEKPRIRPHHLSKELKLRPSSVSKIMKEAFEQGYIFGPHVRKKSYQNFLEYVYFLKSPEPVKLYRKLKEDERVAYHAKIIGFSDIWAIAKTPLDFPGCEIIAQGYRSEYFLSHALNCSWEDSFSTVTNMISDFDPKTYILKNYLQTHWDEVIEWDNTDEILFRELKYDLRKALEPLLKEKYHIGCGSAYEWLKRLPNYCTIATSYFPEGISAYDPYLFMFETEYEDFIVDLFSQLPVSTFFFKVDDKLILYIHVKKEFLRGAGKNGVELDKLQIPLFIEELQNSGIITSSSYGIVEYCWGKDF